MKRLVTLLLVAGSLIGFRDAGATKLAGGVLGNGGTPAAGATSAGKILRGTAGQAAVGRSSGSGRVVCHGYWCFGGVQLLAVDEDPIGSRAPRTLAFGLPSPNPALGPVAFSLTLPSAANVDVGLFDVSGRRVGTLVSSRLDAGSYHVRWDGTDAEGGPVQAGVYFARAIVDGRMLAKRTVVLRR